MDSTAGQGNPFGWAGAGIRSPEHFLVLRAGLSRGQARAVVLLAQRSVELPATTRALREGRISNVFLDTAGGWLLGRPRLPQPVVDGLTCDGVLVPLWETEGVPVSVGPGRRTVPERTRRLILERDRGCRYPGCQATRWLEIHHIRHWRDGGPTDYTNLVAVCTFHHDEHHRNAFSIVGDPTRPDGLTFLTRGGWPIRPGARDGVAPRRAPTGLTLVPSSSDPGGLPALADAPGPPRKGSGGAGRRYRGPSGDVLHLSLVDFTPRQRAAPVVSDG